MENAVFEKKIKKLKKQISKKNIFYKLKNLKILKKSKRKNCFHEISAKKVCSKMDNTKIDHNKMGCTKVVVP